ncbi:type I phosphomannose isomerase catalytic subunit [Winogradskyella alexanderae]|uniref:Phosphohexomutase n=1 Tax=Winogradskyella alexanderae TaxID=2877123 RepID=A0ABS7XRD9_9FLAO|nr:type I phosphomannose isomerase catalytic subunit [Winogradskyella alexanderae]MCA0132590.1 class I mannose-6-phosphate isomerase [Winogradskyella alexanderae]
MKAYPIKFNPILKEKIWGGEKLTTVFNKASNSKTLGESWEISGVNNNVSIVSNGIYKGKSLNELINKFKGDFMGAKNLERFGEEFPLLIKFLDAKTNLSVQVHPDDQMARKYHNSFGKTEMWYIMDNEKDAEIILGLKDHNTAKEKLGAINAKNVKQIFNSVKVNKGDSYFIPAGKVHAIGAGVMVAEIQQTSDITYRVYDWDRVDEKGNTRALHTELATQATKVFPSLGKSKYSLKRDTSSNLVNCQFFTTNIFNVVCNVHKNYTSLDSFVIFMCVEGNAEITQNGLTEIIKMGETVLLPANSDKVTINGTNAKVLEVYINSNLKACDQKAS